MPNNIGIIYVYDVKDKKFILQKKIQYHNQYISYLFISDEVIDFLENNHDGNYKRGFAILLFFITFSILGCIMQVGAYGFA